MDRPDKLPRRRLWVLANWGSALAAIVIAFAAGYVIRWGCAPAPTPTTQPLAAAEELWVCPMNGQHPYYSSRQAGKCVHCGMDLVASTSAGGDPLRLTISDAARRRMGLLTAAVERKLVTAEVRMSGEVDYDETRLGHITAWVGGRIDRLFADSTGVPVRKGVHMVELYSPELLGTQEELLGAIRAVRALSASDVGIVRQTTEATVKAAREKLRLLGLGEEQIAALVKRGRASDRVTINAPSGGIVISIDAKEGSYVKTGTRIYTIADVSAVWVQFDAYESDLQWLRYGQQVRFTTVSLPGREFRGRISLIAPVMSRRSRTVKVRVNAPNPDGALKPGMSADAVVRSTIAAGGRVMAPDLAGKWICQMHPGVIKDAAAKCDVCGMPLSKAETLGYASADPAKAPRPLVVPASAVLQTGKRAVVYVQVAGAAEPTYEFRLVKLGPRAGDYYIVREGLAVGEQVVVKGNFRIDSERKIQLKPSLMDREHAHD